MNASTVGAMSDESRYHLRRGKTPRLVDDVAVEPRPGGDTQPPPSRVVTPADLQAPRTSTLHGATPRASGPGTGGPPQTRTVTLNQPAPPRTVTPRSATTPPPSTSRTVTPASVAPRTTTPTRPPSARPVTIEPPVSPQTRTMTLNPPVQPRAHAADPLMSRTPPIAARTATAAIPALAQGSSPDWRRPMGIDLDDLADAPTQDDGNVPVIERTPTTFGPNQIVVEYHGDRVAIVLPGVVRLIGSVDDGRKLAELLTGRRK